MLAVAVAAVVAAAAVVVVVVVVVVAVVLAIESGSVGSPLEVPRQRQRNAAASVQSGADVGEVQSAGSPQFLDVQSDLLLDSSGQHFLNLSQLYEELGLVRHLLHCEEQRCVCESSRAWVTELYHIIISYTCRTHVYHQTLFKRVIAPLVDHQNLMDSSEHIFISYAFSKLLPLFYQNFTHKSKNCTHNAKCLTISCKMKHCIQNITNTSQKQTFVNTFAII